MRAAAATLLLVAACTRTPAHDRAPGPAPAPGAQAPVAQAPVAPAPVAPDTDSRLAGDSCTSDTDCTVSNWPGCCACPQCSTGEPIARSTAGLAAARDQCKLVRCNTSICDLAGACPPGQDASAFVPTCRAGTCVGVRR